MQQSFAMVGEMKIRYLHSRAGSVDTPSNSMDQNVLGNVLFIHGLGSSSDRWLDIPDALHLSGFNTYAIDLPGFGGSQIRKDIVYSVDRLVEITRDFMEIVRLVPSQTTIVGHSLGGFIAARLVSKFHAAKKLVLVDSSGLLERPTPLLDQYFAAAMNPSKETVRSVFEQMVADPIRIPEALVQGFILRMVQENAKHSFSTAYKDSTSTQLSQNELQQLGSMDESVLVIWGARDKLIPLEFFQLFQQALPKAKITLVPDAGHAPFAEKPATVYELIRSFLCQ